MKFIRLFGIFIFAIFLAGFLSTQLNIGGRGGQTGRNSNQGHTSSETTASTTASSTLATSTVTSSSTSTTISTAASPVISTVEPSVTTSQDASASGEVSSSQNGDVTGGGATNETYTGFACPSACGKLHVDGTKLKDENGNVVQLKGISTHGLAWFPSYVNNDLFSELRNDWNCNLIRLALYTEEYGGYCAGGDKESLKELVKDGVNYATHNDMYVIIDWHILSDNNPNTHKDEAKTFFAEMAELYKDYNNVLYEICNEPNGGTTWADIKSYALEVIPVIRGIDDDAIIIVGTPQWSQKVNEAAADPISDYDNIMYTLHFYADTHKDDLRNTCKNAINDGIAIFITEYGICDASGGGSINYEEAQKWVDLMDEFDISSASWNLSNKAETCAIISSSVSKTSGFTKDDLSDDGKWLYEMMTK